MNCGKHAVLALVGLTGVFISPMSLPAQEQCVGIENDIARLDCFDTAFVALPSSNGTEDPEKIFEEHVSFLRSQHANQYGAFLQIDAAFDVNTCTYVIARGYANPTSNFMNENYTRVDAIAFDAGSLGEVSPDFSRNATKFQMDRGAVAREYTYTANRGVLEGKLKETSDNILNYMVTQGISSDDPTIPTVPAAWLNISTPESEVDYEKAVESLLTLAGACKARDR